MFPCLPQVCDHPRCPWVTTRDWSPGGLRVPACNVLLADIVPRAVYGRAYGFKRAMDNLGRFAGPQLVGLTRVLTGCVFCKRMSRRTGRVPLPN